MAVFLKNVKMNELTLIDDISRSGVTGITSDSRSIGPGFVFVAIPGTKADGTAFIPDAIKRGARVLVVPGRAVQELSTRLGQSVRVVGVDDPRGFLGRLASAFYGEPSRELMLVGITGTNGKTTVSYLLEAVFNEYGIKPGVIGTISRRYGGRDIPSVLTTPDPVAIQSSLADMRREGIGAVAMEVSSHALDQKRVEGCHFAASIFTNLTRDHLDYHNDMEAYFLAKARLFTEYPQGVAVINMDDHYGRRLWSMVKGDKIGYGLDVEAEVRPKFFRCDLAGTTASIFTPKGDIHISSRLIGRHNLSNILAAVAAAVALGMGVDEIGCGIGRILTVPGRLEPVELPEGNITALVDYAHTPDALQNVLDTLSGLTSGRIICVIGCGGDRDKGKRPIMARIAALRADVAVFTSDNPRGEDQDAILDQMMEGLEGLSCDERAVMAQVEVISDRKEAIFRAAGIARAGDCILVAGKGHETYQIIGVKRLPFDDREILKDAFGLGISVSQVAGAIGAKVVCHSEDCPLDLVTVRGVSTDSRTVRPSEVFWAIQGERFDGKNFVKDALSRGACCAVISEKDESGLGGFPGQSRFLVVPDTIRALGDLASWHRRHLGVSVVAITGSCGKTTTKELVASVIGRRWRVVSTRGNFNNLIGLPLSILRARWWDEWAVLEMGMNQPGEIARLSEIAGPDVALITNIRPVHLEGLGDINGVAREKGELFRAMGRDGMAVVNMDDPLVFALSKDFGCKKTFYSSSKGPKEGVSPDVFLESWAPSEMGTDLEINIAGQGVKAGLGLIGTANIRNALAAAAVGHVIGLTNDEIITGLEGTRAVSNRLNLEALGDGFYLMDDSYNANPASMALALESLSRWGKGTKAAILGDMLELGEDAGRFHEGLGEAAVGAGLDVLLAVGSFSDVVIAAAKKTGLSGFGRGFSDTDALIAWLDEKAREFFRSPVTLLVKGSRGVRLERASARLRGLLGVEDKGDGE